MAYFLKKSNLKKGLYLQIYFSYRDPETKQPKNRSIRPLGYLQALQEQGIDDPIAFYQAEVDRLNQQYRAEKVQDKTRKISSEHSPQKHLGYFPLKSVLSSLKVEKPVNSFQMSSRQEYVLYDALQALVYSRAVSPVSKWKTYDQVIPSLFEEFSLSYDQLLSACDTLGQHYEKFVEIFTVATAEQYSLDTSTTFFDCTNFYFEIDRQDDLRRKGPSKEKRTDPIVGMSLLLDKACVPIGMRIYPGNQSEKPEIRDLIADMKRRHNIAGKTVEVADKGLNCAENIYKARANGDGYLFSKSVKQLSEKEKKWVFLDRGWKDTLDAQGNILYSYKSCIDQFDYSFRIQETGQIKKFSSREKRVLTYNPALARKQIEEINKMADKAQRCCLSQAKKSEFGECAKYTSMKSVDIDGGENGKKAVAVFNREAVDRDLELAGYNLLVTSETDMDDVEIYDVYHNLWRIEESFRTLKTELDARPVFLQNHNRIKGHFLICYIAILLTRLFQIKILKDQFGTHQIFKLFRQFQVCQVSERKYINTTLNTKLIDELSKMYNLPLDNYYLNNGDIKKVLGCRLVPLP